MSILSEAQLTQYLQKIGFEGEYYPDFATLQKLQRLHLLTFPFGVLDVHLTTRHPNENPIPIDLDSIFEKLVGKGRDGYCFEQNELFRAVLKSMGFLDVKKYIGAVVFNKPLKPDPNHEVLIVILNEQRYLVDVGFAPRGSLKPIPLMTNQIFMDEEFNTAHRLIIDNDQDFVLQMKLDGEWTSLYAFNTNHRASKEDLNRANRITSMSMESPFVSRLFVAQNTLEGPILVFSDKLVQKGNVSKTQVIQTPKEFCQALNTYFNMHIPSDRFNAKSVQFDYYPSQHRSAAEKRLQTTLKDQALIDAEKKGSYMLRKRKS